MLNIKNKNRGQVLVIFAAALIALLGFAALAIDVAYWYHTRNQLQGAADAAALAGAAKLTTDESNREQPGARSEAVLFAAKNVAAKNSVVVLSDGTNALSAGNDITVGYWDDTTHTYTPNQTPVNAVQVRPRRTNASSPFGASPASGGGPVTTFFGTIVGLSEVNVSTTAIAARFAAPALPIAVNEYWLEKDTSKRPYENIIHEYPGSFVRKTNVDGSTSKGWGKIFAILGSDANDNIPAAGNPGSKNVNSFVNLDSRTYNHDGSGSSWFDVRTDQANPPTLNCSTETLCRQNLFTNTTGITKNGGSISSIKFDASLIYLHDGYPYPLPTAVKEKYRDTATYPASNYPSPTSDCPFATIPYFPSSGAQPINKKVTLEGETDGKKFYERFPKGRKLVALIYDGTFVPDADPGLPNTVTIVGYTLLQIDGYSNTNPKGLKLSEGSTGSTALGGSGNTAYAHVLTDIFEPETATGEKGECDPGYPAGIKELMLQGAQVRLVQ